MHAPGGVTPAAAGDEEATHPARILYPYGAGRSMRLCDAAMTHDTAVWVSNARAGISHHVIAPEGRRTVCGRYIGGTNDVVHGYVFPLAEAQDRFGNRMCRHCTGDTERVDPKIGTRWTS